MLWHKATTRSTLWDQDEPRFSQATVEMVRWKSVPPLAGAAGLGAPRPGAQVLAMVQRQGEEIGGRAADLGRLQQELRPAAMSANASVWWRDTNHTSRSGRSPSSCW